MTEIKTSVIEDARMKRINADDGKVYVILDHTRVLVIESEEPTSQVMDADDDTYGDVEAARFVIDGETDLWVETDNGVWAFCGFNRFIRNMKELNWAVNEQDVTCRSSWHNIADLHEGIKCHGYVRRNDFSVILEEYDGEPDSSW